MGVDLRSSAEQGAELACERRLVAQVAPRDSCDGPPLCGQNPVSGAVILECRTYSMGLPPVQLDAEACLPPDAVDLETLLPQVQ